MKKIKYMLLALFIVILSLFGAFVKSQNTTTGNTAILVTKETYADALVANVISETYNIPIFLTQPNNLSQNLINELEQDNITNIIVIGGPVVISHNITQELRELGFNVTRIWGVTRYQTSAYANLFFFVNSSNAVILTRDIVNENVEARQAYEAAIAEQFAIENHYPLFITPVGTLDPEVAYALEELHVSHVYIFTLESSSLGNITDELQGMNISYTIYTINNVSQLIGLLNCTSIRTIPVPMYISWRDMRYLIIGYPCIIPQPLNNITIFNDTEYKELFEERQFEKRPFVNISQIFERNYYKIASILYLKLEELNYTCYALGFSYPICQRLSEMEEQVNFTLSVLNQTFTNIEELIGNLSEENYEDWALGNETGMYYHEFRFGEIEEARYLKHELKEGFFHGIPPIFSGNFSFNQLYYPPYGENRTYQYNRSSMNFFGVRF